MEASLSLFSIAASIQIDLQIDSLPDLKVY